MKNYISLLFFFLSLSIFAQRGPVQSTTVSLLRGGGIGGININWSDGFDFTGVNFKYQFVNCGGEVQMMVEYDKKANFTTFWYNKKSYSKSEIGADLWPNSSDISIGEVTANLYYGSQNFGKVNLTYIVGNFAGCFGETFGVLKSTGKNPSLNEYKTNINKFTLRDVKVVSGGDSNTGRFYKIVSKLNKISADKKKKERELELQGKVNNLLNSAYYKTVRSDYTGAKADYQKAYALKKDPTILTKIKDIDKLIQDKAEKEKLEKEKLEKERLEREKKTITTPSVTKPSVTSTKKSPTKNPSTTAKKSITPSKPNNPRTTPKYDDLTRLEIENAANRYLNQKIQRNLAQMRLYEQRRQERLRDEREWLAQKRKERREERRRQQQYDDYVKRTTERQKQGKAARQADFNAKGGYTNYSNKLSQWRNIAMQEIRQVNKFLNIYDVQALPFSYPTNNCDFVQAITRISHTDMSHQDKVVLINNMLFLRNEYYKFFMDNGYIEEEWHVGFDDFGINASYGSCGNYLATVANNLDFRKYGPFTFPEKYVINNRIYNSVGNILHSTGNYAVPLGTTAVQGDFVKEMRTLGINMPQALIKYNTKTWFDFHSKTYNWSSGSYRAERSRGAYINYASTNLLYKPEERRSEIQKYINYHDLKQKYRLNDETNEFEMAYFNYHAGKQKEAYAHLMRYIVLAHGSFTQFLENMEKNNYLHSLPNVFDVNETSMVLLTAILSMEAEAYDDALKALSTLSNMVSRINDIKNNTDKRESLKGAINKLRNQIYYRQGAYAKMNLPLDEKAFKAFMKNIDNTFDRVKPFRASKRISYPTPAIRKEAQKKSKRAYLDALDLPLQAHALLKLGKPKLAKKVLEDSYAYYSKNSSKNPRVFYGSPTDIKAYKEAVAQLFPKGKDKIEYRVATGYDLMKERLVVYGNFEELLLNKYIYEPLVPLNFNDLDLTSNSQWETLQNKLQSHDGSKAQLSTLYEELSALYANKRLAKNEETRQFLNAYIQIGVALAKFNEILPVIAQKRHLFPNDKETIVEEHLALFLWPQSRQNKSVIPFFEKELKNNETYKSYLNTYLSIWSRDQVDSPQLPFLYALY